MPSPPLHMIWHRWRSLSGDRYPPGRVRSPLPGPSGLGLGRRSAPCVGRSRLIFHSLSSPAPSGAVGSDRVLSFRAVICLILESMTWRYWQVEPLFDASSLFLRFTGSNQSRSALHLPPFSPCCGLSLETRLWLCPNSWETARPWVSPCSWSSPSEVLRNHPLLYLVRFSLARSGHAHPRVGEWVGETLCFPISLPGLHLEPILLRVFRGHLLAGLLTVLL